MRPSIKNIGKRTPKHLKMLGDFCILMIPTIQAGLISAPEGTFTEHQVWLISFLSSCLLVSVKFFTKLFTDEPTDDSEI
jgi:hypothetical protein